MPEWLKDHGMDEEVLRKLSVGKMYRDNDLLKKFYRLGRENPTPCGWGSSKWQINYFELELIRGECQ